MKTDFFFGRRHSRFGVNEPLLCSLANTLVLHMKMLMVIDRQPHNVCQ